MRVLVLGSTGFVGRNLAHELSARGHEVVGFGRKLGGASWREERVDLAGPAALDRFDERFDAAVLLAGAAVPGPCFDAAVARVNVDIAQRSLAWLARHSRGARVLVMSSAHVYGALGDQQAIDEASTSSPSGLYAESKVAVERAAEAATCELDIVIVRSFNQIGRAMPRGLFVPDLIEALTHGSGPVTMKGPDGVRDFLDVRDGARALADLIDARCASGSVVNLCSGRGVALADLAARLARALSIEREVRFSSVNPVPFVGSRAALTRLTGFEPRIALADTLDWIATAARA